MYFSGLGSNTTFATIESSQRKVCFEFSIQRLVEYWKGTVGQSLSLFERVAKGPLLSTECTQIFYYISDGFAFELGFSEWVYLIPPSQQHFLWTGASVRLDHTQHTLKSPRGLLDYYFQTCRYCHWWGVSSYFRSSVSILRSSTNWSVYFLVRRLGLCLHLWSSLLSQVHCCVV